MEPEILTVDDLFLIRELAQNYLRQFPNKSKLEAINDAKVAVLYNKRRKIKLV